MNLHEEFAASLVRSMQVIERLPAGMQRDLLLAKLSEARSLGDDVFGIKPSVLQAPMASRMS